MIMDLTNDNNRDNYIVETALLGQGLYSIDDIELVQQWPNNKKNLVWFLEGKLKIGSIKDFIIYRKKSKEEGWPRIDQENLERACNEGWNGLITASGAMAIAHKRNYRIVVTAGMGGIDGLKARRMSRDLVALTKFNIILLSTSPKDMLDIEATIKWLMKRDVKVLGYKKDYCNGFIFNKEEVSLSGIYNDEVLYSEDINSGLLILNGIWEDNRIEDKRILQEAVHNAQIECSKSGHFHPLVNKNIDIATKGLSSRLQLKALIDNMAIAERMQIKIDLD